MVIMGRKTWDSLPVKPLPNRTSIVISREDRDEHGSIWVSSPEEALAKANWLNMSTGMPLFVIGGSEIYKAFADKYTHLIATCVDSQFEHDAVFPSLTGVWAEDLSRRLSVGTSELPATVRYFERKDTPMPKIAFISTAEAANLRSCFVRRVYVEALPSTVSPSTIYIVKAITRSRSPIIRRSWTLPRLSPRMKSSSSNACSAAIAPMRRLLLLLSFSVKTAYSESVPFMVNRFCWLKKLTKKSAPP